MNTSLALSPVSFHDHTLFIVAIEGEPFTPMKPIVEGMGVDWKTQHRKLVSNKDRWGVVIMTIPSESGDQETLCMPVRKLPAFFASVNPGKVGPAIKDRILMYQNECDDALWDYWTKGQATRGQTLPTAPALELTPSTTADRQPLKDLVDAWVGTSPISYSAAWKQVNAHFSITKISFLPKEWIPDAIAFVQERIDAHALPAATPPALPPANDNAAILQDISMKLNREIIDFQDRLRPLFRELQDAYGDKIYMGNVHKSSANSARWDLYKAVNSALDVTSSMAWNAQYTLNCLCSTERALK